MFILAAAKEMLSYKQKVVSVCISHKIHSLFLWISEMLDTVWWFTMKKLSYQNPLSTSLRNIQSFSFSVSSFTNDSPVTGSLAVYKWNMNKAKENT